jgi:hypothetical protein
VVKWRTRKNIWYLYRFKARKHHFEYQIDNKFFEIFDYNEYQDSNIKVNVVLDKKSTELSFKHKGYVNVPCDLTSEDFDLPVKEKWNL